MIKRLVFILCICLLIIPCAGSQSLDPAYAPSGRPIPSTPRFGVKSNLLYDATGTFSLGFEVKLDRKLTLDVPVTYNPWTFSDNRKWKHLLVQPEVRFWLCEPFSGHFLGAHAHYAYYNIGNLRWGGPLKTYRYEGWLAGAGVSYGYHWLLSNRWSVEGSLGIGYAYLNYDKYDCRHCGDYLRSDHKHYFGTTKAAISLIYIIK